MLLTATDEHGLPAAEQTGARGLLTVLEGALRHFKFELPGTALTKLEVDASMIRQPQVALRRLLEEAGAGMGAV